ncbi:MAG: PP2C family protein-serine/threonine phosphatase [Woeseiaceae bacterium]
MLKYFAITDPGNREGENEDSIGWDESRNIWFVADGMGGHAAGSTASDIARKSLLAADPATSVADQLVAAHQAIVDAADQNNALSGMGSTAVVVWFEGSNAEVSWVGDSRAYLWRGGQLRQVSRDHSFLEVMRAQNLLTEEQILADPRSNLVTQTLGLGDPQPSVESVALRNGDWILLCSDGLNDEVAHEQLEDILGKHHDVEAAVTELVATALDNGGRDNTSVILVEYSGGLRLAPLWRIMDSKWLPLIIGAALAVLFALLLWFNR